MYSDSESWEQKTRWNISSEYKHGNESFFWFFIQPLTLIAFHILVTCRCGVRGTKDCVSGFLFFYFPGFENGGNLSIYHSLTQMAIPFILHLWRLLQNPGFLPDEQNEIFMILSVILLEGKCCVWREPLSLRGQKNVVYRVCCGRKS